MLTGKRLRPGSAIQNSRTSEPAPRRSAPRPRAPRRRSSSTWRRRSTRPATGTCASAERCSAPPNERACSPGPSPHSLTKPVPRAIEGLLELPASVGLVESARPRPAHRSTSRATQPQHSRHGGPRSRVPARRRGLPLCTFTPPARRAPSGGTNRDRRRLTTRRRSGTSDWVICAGRQRGEATPARDALSGHYVRRDGWEARRRDRLPATRCFQDDHETSARLIGPSFTVTQHAQGYTASTADEVLARAAAGVASWTDKVFDVQRVIVADDGSAVVVLGTLSNTHTGDDSAADRRRDPEASDGRQQLRTSLTPWSASHGQGRPTTPVDDIVRPPDTGCQ